MATVKSVSIIIGGQKRTPYNLSIQQRFDWHHRFEVSITSERMEGNANGMSIDNSIAYVGQIAEIDIQRAGGSLKFKGVITNVHIDRTYTGDSLIVFGGYSPTYLMEDGIGTKSYAEKDIAAIVNEILGPYKWVTPIVDPQYTSPIPYIVRYKETNYHFLSRIAATYGEWFYYDGKNVVLGKLPNPPSIDLTLGKDLDSFDYGVQLRPSKFKYQFYNYQENRLVEEVSTGFKPGWLDNYGKKALDAADGIFPNEPINPTWQDAPDQKLIKHLVEARKSSIVSDMAFFKGQSTNPGVMVGGRIRAKAINKVMGQNVEGLIGNFRVTAVTHHLDANKNYSNHFEAVPMTVTAPPMNRHVSKPEAESLAAVVKKNDDEIGLGRIRVQFNWQTGDEMTPWIRQITGHASGDRGMYFVPEVGDEVYVDFEQGNPDRPFVIGTKYHGNTAPEFFDKDNNLKSIKTRSGHTILMNDKNGEESITINDKNGNIIHLDTKGSSITISAPETITLNATDINLNAGNSINMKADPGKDSGTGLINIEAKEDIKVESETKDITLEAKDKNVNIKTKENVDIKAEKKIDASGKTCVKISSDANVEIEGKKCVKVSSDVKTEVIGKLLKLKATGIAILKGKTVKIN